MHPFLKSCHFQPLASFWSHNLASWNIYISTSLKLLLHGRRNKSIVVIFLCLAPFAKISIRNFLGRLTCYPQAQYYFLVDCFSRTGFQKSFFFRFKQFILYLLFRLFVFPPLGDLGDRTCRLQVNSRQCCCLKLLESLRAIYYLNR